MECICNLKHPSTKTEITTLDPTFLEAIQSTIDAAVSKSMGRIVEEVRSLRRDIAELRNSRDNVPSKRIMPAEALNTVEQFMELESLLQKDEEYAKFKSELMQNIKYTGAKFVRTTWRSLVSDECAQHFAWSGTSDKKPVRVLKVPMAIRAT
ncbi:uncharacterized protein LOC126764228 isoform X1 [Bactrocera neohumeralis]|uniref:uncharacterized protein LOC126764228 isoform X1 n=1 Tax=Bactrocera neohumeralis TaxID=98809 RepID=UPI0021653B45|nr:uncharacterized protein LOC126764228 isoform X1 [Bactrocera neohumeralis]XP_050337987.1 uncharacterized protein LOC126764228 isoform X1 [Bactrocera neohumeralis]